MGYATDGHRTDVRVQKNQRVIRQMNLNGWQAVIIQTETVSEETWVGLSKVEAESFCVASESSTLNGSTRPYLGGCTVSNTTPFESSIYATACWGTRVQSQMQRMGDTNLYQVSKTTTIYDVSAPSGTMTKW